MIAAISLVVLASVVYLVSYDLLIAPQPLSKEPVKVAIRLGASTTEIANLLEKKKVIRNPYFFLLSAKTRGLSQNLKAGVYNLHQNMDYEAVLNVLEKGPAQKVFKVIVPEGLTINQTANRIAKQSDIDADVLLSIITSGGIEDIEMINGAPWATYEGFLFPKTYEVFEGTRPEQLVRKMLKQFMSETKSIDWRVAETWGLTKYDIIIISSLIEREAKLSQERNKVAAVIYNRLQKNMLLQIDATVQYALGGNNQKLTTEDLKIDSPYNTYVNQGLPPGPICSPGLESIKAALQPVDADFLYYVLTGKDGSHTFTGSYDEFLKAKAAARESLK